MTGDSSSRWWLLVAVAIVVVAIVALISRPHTGPTSREAPEPGPRAARSAEPEVKAFPPGVQDPQDHDPRLRARMRRRIVENPAFQHLPFEGDDIHVDFADTTRDGRVRLIVTFSTTRARARVAYETFLRYWRDDGDGYAVTYRPGPRSPLD